MSSVRVAWYKNTNNIISTILCLITFVMAYNYWTLSQEMVLLDAKVRICEQKELDFNGVATECKKRVSELHDKVSVLTSDKEVITTQKNSLFELAQSRERFVSEWKKKYTQAKSDLETALAEKKKLEEEKNLQEGKKESDQNELDQIKQSFSEANSKNEQLQNQVNELSAKLNSNNNEEEDSLNTGEASAQDGTGITEAAVAK